MSRVCIIGLDSAPPELVFEELRGSLPHLTALAARSLAGKLESTVPPITVPAWSAMVTGVDPGVLGCYGFRDRADRSYDARRLASSLAVNAPALWTYVGRAGGLSRILTVPQTYPPKPLAGWLVSDAPAIGGDGPTTYPPELAGEVRRVCGGELVEPADHRTLPLDELHRRLQELTTWRFRLARQWAAERDWRLMMIVEMGPDRMQHAFWRFHADRHDGGAAPPAYARALRDYYAALDAEVGALLAALDPDDIVLVLSDHGARSMRGGIAVNQWLHAQGYLVLGEVPGQPTPFDALAIDWRRTRAWADGGYVARIYFNVAGREPLGALEPAAIEAFTAELTAGLRALRGPMGEALATTVYRPVEVYRAVRGVAPDLIVYFDDLAYRALGSVGHPTLYPAANDTGRDHANHTRHGIIILHDHRGPRPAPPDASIYDVAPTVLDRLGLAVPALMRGRVLV